MHLSHSGDLYTLSLQYEGNEISWQHLDLDDTKSDGKRLVPKLKYEHIYLTTFSKMRVDLAAEVRVYTCNKLINFLWYLLGPE